MLQTVITYTRRPEAKATRVVVRFEATGQPLQGLESRPGMDFCGSYNLTTNRIVTDRSYSNRPKIQSFSRPKVRGNPFYITQNICDEKKLSYFVQRKPGF